MTAKEGVQPWRRVNEKVVADYRIFRMADETYARPDGAGEFPFYVILSVDWVNVVPVTPEGKVVLIRQWRAGSDEVAIEVPGGMVDPGEDPQHSAARELEEETGYRCDTVVRTGKLRPNPAIQRNFLHTFVAIGARPDGHLHLEEREDISSFEATWDEVDAMIRSGAIDHALVINALLFARRVLAEGTGR
jgi:8-oxo-dGTP pyrophosphatase MutT (NUDIX family)